MSALAPCPGCGARLLEEEGPTHRYMTGSPACWAAFGRILAAEYRDPERWAGHAFTVDAYAVQHPGEGSREAVRSVGVHLVSLHFTLERGMDPGLMARVRQGAAERLGESLPRLDPPADPGTCTVRDLLTGPGLQTPLPDAAEHARRSREWAEEAWRSWSDHHEAVARWADWLVAASPPGFPQGGVKR